MNTETNETIATSSIILAFAIVMASVNLGGCGSKHIELKIIHETVKPK
jgi:hypothetical protein